MVNRLLRGTGRAARFIAHVPDADSEDCRVIYIADGEVVSTFEGGDYLGSTPSYLDIFMAPKPKVVRWLVLCRDGTWQMYKDKYWADGCEKSDSKYPPFRIEIEE